MTYPLPAPPPESKEPPVTPPPVSAARRRRERRTLLPRDPAGRSAVLVSLARRSYPSVEFFFYALLCGLVLGLGYLLDSPTVLVLGALIAPLMTPWVGMTLAAVTGSARFFTQTLAAIFVAAALAFTGAALSGVAARAFLPLTFNLGYYHSRLWPADLTILTLSAILLTITFLRTEDKPYLPSAMLAYQFFLPVAAAGFGLGSGNETFWPAGVLVFLTHLAWATFCSGLTLVLLRFWPRTLIASFVSLIIFLFMLITLVGLTGVGTNLLNGTVLSQPEPAPVIAAASPTVESESLSILVETPSLIPTLPFKVTVLPTATFDVRMFSAVPPSETPTATLPPEPTPIYARIDVRGAGGAYLRKEPGGDVLLTLDNGDVVRVLPETKEYDGRIYIHVIATRGEVSYEGWVIQTALVTATPVPGW